MKLGIHVLVLEHTTKIKVNVVVNNVVLVKQPQARHSAISETRRCRAMNLGEEIHGQNSYYFFSNKPHCITTISVEKV